MYVVYQEPEFLWVARRAIGAGSSYPDTPIQVRSVYLTHRWDILVIVAPIIHLYCVQNLLAIN